MFHTFQLQQRQHGDVVVLDLAGSLTVGAAEQKFKDMIADLIARQLTNVLLNMERLEFIDSSGIGALVRTYTTITQKGGKLKVLKPAKMVRHSLEITGLMNVFEIFGEEPAALSSF